MDLYVLTRQDLETLLEVDPRIRFVLHCDSEGHERAMAKRDEVASMDSSESTRLILAQAAIGNDMAHVHDSRHGTVRMVIIQREKLMLILFSTFDGFVLVSAEPDLPLEKAAELGRRLDMVGSEPAGAPPVQRRGAKLMKGDLR